jgi:hypothetical protein
VSMVTAVGLLVVTLAFWLGQAEAQHTGGKGRAAPAHPPKGGAGKQHLSPPKGKAQHKSKGGPPKKAQKKEKRQDAAKEKHDTKKKHTLTKEERKARKEDEKHAAKTRKRERAKEAKSKVLVKAPRLEGAGLGPDTVADEQSISLLQQVHQELQEVNRDYGGHRRRALEHVGAALGHLGASAPTRIRTGKGRMNVPQPVSNATLQEARMTLERIRNQFAAESSGYGDAHDSVDEAIREIDLALAVR